MLDLESVCLVRLANSYPHGLNISSHSVLHLISLRLQTGFLCEAGLLVRTRRICILIIGDLRALFLYRIYPAVQIRYFLKYTAAIVICFGLAYTIILFCSCTPLHAFWDTLAGELPHTKGSHCINVTLMYMANGIIDTVINFVLLVMVRVTLKYPPKSSAWLNSF